MKNKPVKAGQLRRVEGSDLFEGIGGTIYIVVLHQNARCHVTYAARKRNELVHTTWVTSLIKTDELLYDPEVAE